MRGLRWICVPLSVAVLGVMLAATAGATTTKVPVSGTEVTTAVTDPGTFWVSGNVAHMRGFGTRSSITGSPEIAGTNSLTINWNVNTVTGAGSLWGTFDDDVATSTGGFAGSWNGTFTDTGWSGSAVGEGYGALAGWQERLDLESVLGVVYADGYVFSPADK